MIDARNTFRKVTTTLNDFSENQLNGLTFIIDSFRGRAIPPPDGENPWIDETFPKGKYKDIEGLCKVVDLEEIKEQDYSLTPGRYVGVSIDIDMDFDYKGRISEIHAELYKLNEDANQLMNQIQSFS